MLISLCSVFVKWMFCSLISVSSLILGWNDGPVVPGRKIFWVPDRCGLRGLGIGIKYVGIGTVLDSR